jgi:iron complex transport system ATP-binding protein
VSDDERIAAMLDDVSFGYDARRPIIRALNLVIARARVTAVLGPNGSGKTTLLKLIAGALRPTSGRVTVNERVGFVPQIAQVAFSYTVFDMVLMGRARQIGVFSTPTRRDEDAAAVALERVGMLAFAQRAFDTLSGGERQLVMFARALASDASMLVLDEPTAALDLSHQRLVLRRVDRLRRESGTTIVFSTHQPELAAAVADHVVLMFANGSVRFGTTASVLTAQALTELFGIDVRRAVVGTGTDSREVFVPSWDMSRDDD